MSENDTMNDEFVTDVEITRFLLGDVDDQERRRLESLFISDPKAKERILIVENELIDDYLEDSLAPADRDRFIAQYETVPQQRRKLRTARAIKDYAVADAILTQTPIPAKPKWRSFLSSLGPQRPMWFIPIAATLMVACVVAILWLMQLNSRRAQENNRRVAIERELAELNQPASLHELPPQMFSMVLPPGSIRSVAPQAELTPRPDMPVVELHLLWIQKEQYLSYRAVIHPIGKTEQFNIADLHVEDRSGGNTVRVRLPVHILSRGLYQVLVNGVGRDGAAGPAEEYTFTVGG
jgi:hypothetical protein